MQIRFIVALAISISIIGCKNDTKRDVAIVNNPRTAQGTITTDKNDLGRLAFTDTLHDFGSIIEGEVVEYEFEYKNVGKRPILINMAQASCGCTVAEYKREPIAVGETGTLKVKFNSTGKFGKNTKSVHITTNGYPSGYHLEIIADVKNKPSYKK